jgi:hypothetical protein
MNAFQSRHCTETKILLSGDVHRYACTLLHQDNTFGILRYVIDREYRVGSVRLMPSDVTYGLYWTDRPYTLYIWHVKDSDASAYYFNIADRILLSENEFQWRDLILDILIDSGGIVQILDENELPPDLSTDLRSYILTAKTNVLTHYRDIIIETDILVKQYSLL